MSLSRMPREIILIGVVKVSTNFYMRGRADCQNEKHIGKTTCGEIVWAIFPIQLEELCNENMSEGCPCCGREYDMKDKVIEDEYNDLYTIQEFMVYIDGLRHDKSLIGVDFS